MAKWRSTIRATRSRFTLPSKVIDVWSMDYRTHFIPPQTPQNDLSELAGWTNDLFESDINAAAAFVGAQSGRGGIFVAGFSRGVEFAYLFAAKHYPERVAGIIALDGFIPTHPMRSEPLASLASMPTTSAANI